MKNPAALRIEGFSSSFADFRVEADFKIAPGERVALYSPSGSGKTTLLRWIAGIAEESAGTRGKIFIGEREITHLPPESRSIGFVFQDYALFPMLSALENVAFGLEMRGVSRSERTSRSMAWIERLGLKERARVPAALLSGGEKQRVALARALIWKPEILLLDEPFAALDLAHRKNAREFVRSLLDSDPVPMLFVSHDAADVEAIATRTLGYRAVSGPSKGVESIHVFG